MTLSKSGISGNWATLLLPIKSEVIDFESLEQQIDCYIAAGVDGIYSNGTAGEFYTQSEEEFQQISKLLAQKCHQAGMAFQIGASHCHPQAALERVKFAATLNPTAIQVILPDWFPCSLAVAKVFMHKVEQVAQGVDLVLYNPPHAKVNLTANELDELYEAIPKLVGFKLPRITPEITITGLAEKASIFVAGHFLATDAYKGAKGAYSNVCCLNPKATQAWTQDCLALVPSALELESRIQRFMNEEIAPYITDKGYCNAAVDKFMAALGGWSRIESTMRFPFASIPMNDIECKIKIKNELLPEFKI
ncbi:dihydrodipicolinate synthetase [Vibrio ichthyoenteri ATCC 700023]|uniref:Dihydrodipicolinate synthetase n=1 Tax=Vibrio ichthyoenteri ATCC 700023 TaxID=870968 RepID=F9S6D8_9VIBR|nr:dihydrodipicolinate synthase family protein [Vibrio ichthyoenteri]EGU33523.1 dihydrodipicolinate synthetase [Vibrio ichthyoenteri ATCC 700023]